MCLTFNTEVSLLVCVVREREQLPRFAQPGSFEYEYAMRWKALMEMEKQQFEQVDRNIKEAQEKLEQEMEAARHEHQVMLMRQGESLSPNLPFLVVLLTFSSSFMPFSHTLSLSVCLRSVEEAGGAKAYGGGAQPGGAEEEADGAASGGGAAPQG